MTAPKTEQPETATEETPTPPADQPDWATADATAALADMKERLLDTSRGTVVDLSNDGILWAINRVVFHPRGFALAYHPGSATPFALVGDGSECVRFGDKEVEDARFRAFNAALARQQESVARRTAEQ